MSQHEREPIEGNAADSTQQVTNPIRRRVVGYGLALVGGTVAGTLTSVLMPDECPPPNRPTPPSPAERETPRKDVRVYTSGETITTPAGSVRMNDWRLIFDSSELQTAHDRLKAGGRDFSLSVIHANSGYRPVVTGRGYARAHSEYVDGNEYFIVTVVPLVSIIDGYPYLHYQETEGEKITREEFYPLSPRVFTYDRAEPRDRQRIFSEIDLGQDEFSRIHALARDFSSFTGDVDIFVYKTIEGFERGGTYDFSRARIELPSMIFTDPAFPNEGLLTAFHELSSALMFSAKNYSRDAFGSIIQLYNDYQALLSRVKENISDENTIESQRALQEDPRIAIFRYSSYLNEDQKGSYFRDFSYPHYNMEHFLASCLTVLRFFPDQFLKRFESLDESEKKLISKAVESALGVTQDLDKSLELLHRLLPQYDKIKAAISNT